MKKAVTVSRWLPLDAAAEQMKLSASRIRSHIRNGRLMRGTHFRMATGGGIELNIDAYLEWHATENRQKRAPLVDRLKIETSATDSKFSSKGRHPPVVQEVEARNTGEGKRMPKLIPVSVWADLMFGEYKPARNTLHNWIKAGKIVPMPTKVGRTYFCSPDAEYFDPVVHKIRRMTGGS